MRCEVLIALAVCACFMSSVVPHDAEDSSIRVSLTAEETVLRIGFMQKVDSLNPFMGLTDASRVFYSLVYDSLFSVGNDLETVGDLATEWRPVPVTDPEMIESGEPYGSVWEYNLTTNAQWHDGEPFTAEDAAWVINLNAENYDSLWAYQPYTYFMDHAEVIDSDTVRIHFFDRSSAEPMPVAYADSLYIPMVPRHKLSEATPASIAFTWNGTFSDSAIPIVGTGPFMATDAIWGEYEDGEQLTLVKNPNYHWAADKGETIQFDKIVMHFYDDAFAMAFALRAGYLDIAQFPPQTYLGIEDDVMGGTLENVECFDGLKATQYWTEIAFNMNDAGPNPARLDPAVRQALAMATDKQYIVDVFYAGCAEPGSTLISPVSEAWHYEPTSEELFQCDLDAAAQLLEDSGYRYTVESPDVRAATADSLAVQEGYVPDGTPLEFDMMVRRECPEEREIASYLDEVWMDIGVNVNYRVLDEATLATEVYKYEYDSVIWYWSSDPDPNYMLFCQSKYSWGGWSDNLYFNESYDENYNSSVTALDHGARKTYVDECQRIHYEDAAYIILAYPNQTYAWRTDTFSGWGDWEENPGRSMDAYWGANPLLFDLTPITALNTAPTDVSLSLPSADVYAGDLIAFTVSAEDVDMDDLLIELDFGDGMAEAQTFLADLSTHYETTFMHTYDLPGEYELTVTADDQTGLLGHVVAYGPVMFTVLEDDIPPVTAAALDGDIGDNGWYVSVVTVSLSAADGQSDVDGTWYCVDGGTWMQYSAAFEVTGDGAHEVEFYSVDMLGNEESVLEIEFKVDTQTPTVVPSIVVEDGYTYFRYLCADEASGLAFSEYGLDGGSFVNMGDNSSVSIQIATEGEHTIVVRIHDNAGNNLTSTTTFTVAPRPDDAGTLALYVGFAVVVAAIAAVAAVLLIKRKR